ncbi:hypothetical protein QAD02_016183 [Eretmocerus hayati]|uniref:Uncharacterized protein n=1 Tax=Eretmocerus hayati TaxID=131215 RepID=A0ACC2PC67_9HYME|nr:hypothetical protein QAD02_016183 [Eretmocerus hayati]
MIVPPTNESPITVEKRNSLECYYQNKISDDRRSISPRRPDPRDDPDRREDFERFREERRRAWRLQQEREKEHELLKQKKIEGYEKKRAASLRFDKTSCANRSRATQPPGRSPEQLRAPPLGSRASFASGSSFSQSR